MTKPLILILLALWIPGCSQDISPERVRQHVQALASDDLEGRGTGTSGEEKAARYIEKEFKRLKLKPAGDASGTTYRQPFPFKGGIHGTGTEGKSLNMAAFLDNGAPHTVIIGAHFDHLGLGQDGNSLDPDPKQKIHNGADDNASGVAGVLELARYFAGGKKESSNILFLCFSGEELGLIGSKYWTEHPTIDIGRANYMINLDMVGRFEAAKGLFVSGTGTSPVWETMMKEFSTSELAIKTDSSGTGPSDHTSFYLKNLPVLHFFTGSHQDYHKPSDDSDKINAEGEAAILRVIARIVEDRRTGSKLAFLPTKSKTTVARSAFKVTLGVMPSYTADVSGLRVDGVSEGKPAKKAGILTGDIITRIGEEEIIDIETYMDALGKFEKGQSVPVMIRRGEKSLTVTVTF